MLSITRYDTFLDATTANLLAMALSEGAPRCMSVIFINFQQIEGMLQLPTTPPPLGTIIKPFLVFPNLNKMSKKQVWWEFAS